jgi:hypothetical protein
MRTIDEHMASRGNRPLTVVRCCGSMYDARRSTGALMRPPHPPGASHRARPAVLVGEAQAPLHQHRPDPDDPTGSPSVRKEPAMQIGKEQQEFEILPTEEDQQPVAPPPPQPQPQPQDAPA